MNVFIFINRLSVAVYYDDMFKEEFGDTVNTRIEAIMAIVDEMYSERNTLATEFEVTTIATEYSKGSNWGMVSDWGRELLPWCKNSWFGCYRKEHLVPPGNDLSSIAMNSPHNANLYVFMTGSASKDSLGRAADIGTLCDQSRQERLNINKFAENHRGGDTYTAEVCHEVVKN